MDSITVLIYDKRSTPSSAAWQRFESAVLAFSGLRIHVAIIACMDACSSILKALEDQATISPLTQLYKRGLLELSFRFATDGAEATLRELAASTAKCYVDGSRLPLSLEALFRLWLCLFDENGHKIGHMEAESRMEEYMYIRLGYIRPWRSHIYLSWPPER